jgi:hypothetical protein
MPQLVHRAGSCEDGPCPNVFDVTGDGREDMAAVQGATGTDPSVLAQLSRMPAHESLVLVPRRLLLEYADRVRAEERNDT